MNGETFAAPIAYWEARARRFARVGAGLRAVCSYGMPWFYNAAIHLTQWLALRRWLRVATGRTVLDVGCGIGRWSRMLARRGARLTGVDLAPTMIGEARRRTAAAKLDCIFRVADLTDFDLGEQYSMIVGVTVLQHIMDDNRFGTAIRNLARHLEPGGRLILLEAAPSRPVARCDSDIFRARTASLYQRRFEEAGLRCLAVTGVDPAPFKTLYLPFHRSLPKPVANVLLLLVTLASLPIDLIFGRLLTASSWHKIFVLEKN